MNVMNKILIAFYVYAYVTKSLFNTSFKHTARKKWNLGNSEEENEEADNIHISNVKKLTTIFTEKRIQG